MPRGLKHKVKATAKRVQTRLHLHGTQHRLKTVGARARASAYQLALAGAHLYGLKHILQRPSAKSLPHKAVRAGAAGINAAAAGYHLRQVYKRMRGQRTKDAIHLHPHKTGKRKKRDIYIQA